MDHIQLFGEGRRRHIFPCLLESIIVDLNCVNRRGIFLRKQKA
jgi:hypothetical protein